MSVHYVTVQWTKRKIVYDVLILLAVVAYLQVFSAASSMAHSGAQSLDSRIVPMRAWGSCAFLMLTVILSIGPLARLDKRFLPLLYNRRHLGVMMFGVAAVHAYHVLGYYFAYGPLDKVEALLRFDTVPTPSSAPFTLFGVGALCIFFVMALTSHDFWQKVLGGAVWKWLHMSVYLGYALVVLHVAFGALQFEDHPGLVGLIGASVLWAGGLHAAAALRSTSPDKAPPSFVDLDGQRWVDAGPPEAIPDGRAIGVAVPGQERIAVVRSGDEFSAIHGVCRHQGGPLYEGKVIDGALTCPWHGWTYRPCDGRSPPPFTETVPTYRIRLSEKGRLLVDTNALPAGTQTPPVVLGVRRREGDA